MNDNSNNINDFDKYVKNQIETITYDFNEKSWEQLDSKLNQLDAKNATFLSDKNYKSLFFITATLLIVIVVASIFYYFLTNKPTKEILQPINESSTNTPSFVETEIIKLDTIQKDSLIITKQHPKVKKHNTEQLFIKPETNSQLKEEAIPQESQKENKKMESDSLSENKKTKKYIVW
jgi:hypothetical protein